MFQEQTIPIPDHLRAFVRRVWMLEPGTCSRSAGSNKFSIYADGCPGLIFQESESGLMLNQQRKLSPVFLYGQTVDPIDMHTNGRLGMIVVSFHPHVLRSLFGFSAKDLTDACLDLGLLSAVPGIRLQERLWNAVSADERMAVLFNYIGQVIARNRSVTDAGMAYVTEKMFRTNGRVSLQQMQRELHLSPRTFERRFEQYVGVSPKLFPGSHSSRRRLGSCKAESMISFPTLRMSMAMPISLISFATFPNSRVCLRCGFSKDRKSLFQ